MKLKCEIDGCGKVPVIGCDSCPRLVCEDHAINGSLIKLGNGMYRWIDEEGEHTCKFCVDLKKPVINWGFKGI